MKTQKRFTKVSKTLSILLALVLVLSLSMPNTFTAEAKTKKSYGNIKGNITWQYNDYVGTKGDNGAYVALIPINGNTKKKSNKIFAMLMDTDGKNGIYSTKADGYGKYVIDDVPVGKYMVFIVSKNTTSGDRFDDENAWLDTISDLFDSYINSTDMKTIQLMIGYKNYHIDTVTIKKNKTKTLSYDFGNTYI